MRLRLILTTVVFGFLPVQLGMTQAPEAAPAGATGQCNDSSYTTTATKRGACRGHQGVKAWFAAAPSTSSPSSAPTPTQTPAQAPSPPPDRSPTPEASAPAPAPKAMTHTTGTPAAGGGPGLVWLNSSTNVYHCYGARYYGTTKAGKYVTEVDAKAAGAHADHGKACSQ